MLAREAAPLVEAARAVVVQGAATMAKVVVGTEVVGSEVVAKAAAAMEAEGKGWLEPAAGR